MQHTTKERAKEITAWQEENKHSRESPVLGESLFKSRVTSTLREGDQIFGSWFDSSDNYAQQNSSNIAQKVRFIQGYSGMASPKYPKSSPRGFGGMAVPLSDRLTECLPEYYMGSKPPLQNGWNKRRKRKEGDFISRPLLYLVAKICRST